MSWSNQWTCINPTRLQCAFLSKVGIRMLNAAQTSILLHVKSIDKKKPVPASRPLAQFANKTYPSQIHILPHVMVLVKNRPPPIDRLLLIEIVSVISRLFGKTLGADYAKHYHRRVGVCSRNQVRRSTRVRFAFDLVTGNAVTRHDVTSYIFSFENRIRSE